MPAHTRMLLPKRVWMLSLLWGSAQVAEWKPAASIGKQPVAAPAALAFELVGAPASELARAEPVLASVWLVRASLAAESLWMAAWM